jgi:hypothetical protein
MRLSIQQLLFYNERNKEKEMNMKSRDFPNAGYDT